jgi:hypothetical protein
MDDAVGVGVGEGVRDLRAKAAALLLGEALLASKPGVERSSRRVLHHEEPLPRELLEGVEDQDARGGPQAGRGARLPLDLRETLLIRGHLGRQEFDRDFDLEHAVPAEEDPPHAAAAQEPEDLVARGQIRKGPALPGRGGER